MTAVVLALIALGALRNGLAFATAAVWLYGLRPHTPHARRSLGFIACLIALYGMSSDPLFLVILGIVLVGLVLTLTSYLADRARAAL